MNNLLLFTLGYVCISTVIGFKIRLWPVNARGNEGFVEAYHKRSWGLIGSPAFRFTDATASFLCRTLGLSEFGYSSGWTSLDNYGGYVWLHELECVGNETDIEQCNRPSKWNRYYLSSKSDWSYMHGTRLFCIDSRLRDGVTQNSGLVEASFDGKTYTLCYDGMDIDAANVVCNHFGYDGAISIVKGEQEGHPLYDKKIWCKGCEYSLTNCDRSATLSSTCYHTAIVTCKAVRIARLSRYKDEGPVEVFHDGSRGFVGTQGYSFNDKTASYLCKRFGLSDVGFSTTGHSLATFGRKAWLHSLSCHGNETNIMQCQHSNFGSTPMLMHTYRRGTWLYCFSYNITNIRLTGGKTAKEGRVELLINGRWGSISTSNAIISNTEKAAKVICSELGYSSLEKFYHILDMGRNANLFWMSEVLCKGYEDSITKCQFRKGPSARYFKNPVCLGIRCTGNSEVGSGSPFVGNNNTSIRLTGGQTTNEGRVEVLINGIWESISTSHAKYSDTEKAAKVICSELGYSSLVKFSYLGTKGKTDDSFWMSDVRCTGNEDSITKCSFRKGPVVQTITDPVYLNIRCTGKSKSGSGSPIVI